MEAALDLDAFQSVTSKELFQSHVLETCPLQ